MRLLKGILSNFKRVHESVELTTQDYYLNIEIVHVKNNFGNYNNAIKKCRSTLQPHSLIETNTDSMTSHRLHNIITSHLDARNMWFFRRNCNVTDSS